MRVVVTGANGFVGRHLVKELASHGLNVIGLAGSSDNKQFIQGYCEVIEINLLNRAGLKAISFKQVDQVIHLAGLASVGPSFNKPGEYLNTNAGMQINLFEEAIAQDTRPGFLIISSGSLYDPHDKLPLTETSSVVPSSPYAVSKLVQEQFAAYYSNRGFNCVVARPFNHIGPGQSLGFIVPDLVSQVVNGGKDRHKKVLVGNLESKRDYTDVRDIARAYRLLAEKGKPGNIYNVCSGVAISGNELLEKITKQSGSKVEMVKDQALIRPSDNPIIYGSHKKLTKDTGWEPKIKLEQTLADVLEEWKKK